MTPPTLARRLQSLPPMLHMRNPSPMPRCSKAPRGLFVQVCVTRVFTGISVSPGPSSRQRPSRYTFRAGRNLPDKEFRYLRTVHVLRSDDCRTVGFDSGTHSACRHAVRTFSSPTSVCVSEPGVKSLRIPQPFGTAEIFPADCPHLSRCHRRRRR